MVKQSSVIAALTVFLLIFCPVPGSHGQPLVTSPPPPLIKFIDYTLPNGLRILLSPDKTVPVVSICVTYNVGSRDERPGQAGLAHLSEHMMFQGSANVGRGEHFRLMQEMGGYMNAYTTSDYTEYIETVPSNQLNLVLFLEADRMNSLDITQPNLENQRLVVKSEKREDHDHQVYSDLERTMLKLSFTRFPYAHPGIGYEADIDAVTLAQARKFHQTYYAPNNAVLSLVGNFDIGAAKARITHYFQAIPRHAAPPPVDTTETVSTGMRFAKISDLFSRDPLCAISYRTAPAGHPDFPALEVLLNILGDGRSSRIYHALVERHQAQRVSTSFWPLRGPSLFGIEITPPAENVTSPLEMDVQKIINRIQKQGVTPPELRKAKNEIRAKAVLSLYTTLARARRLSNSTIIYGSLKAVNNYLPNIQAVTNADIERVARRYLQPSNQVVIMSVPMTGDPGRARGQH